MQQIAKSPESAPTAADRKIGTRGGRNKQLSLIMTSFRSRFNVALRKATAAGAQPPPASSLRLPQVKAVVPFVSLTVHFYYTAVT